MRTKAIAMMLQETHSYRRDYGDDRWRWQSGLESLPKKGQTFPPGGMGILVDANRIPGCRVLEVGKHSMWTLIPGASVDLIVGNTYVHRDRRSNALEEIKRCLKKYGSQGLVVWGGDMNARYGCNGDTKVNNHGTNLMNFADDLGFVAVNTCANLCTGLYSRVEVTKSAIERSTIDYVFVPKGELHRVDKLQICSHSGLDSDHRPMAIQLRWSRKETGPPKVSKRAKHTKYRVSEMDDSSWDRYENLLDVNMVDWMAKAEDLQHAIGAAHWLTQDVSDVLERTWRMYLHDAARTAVGTKLVGQGSKPWFDRQISTLRTLRDKAHRLALVADANENMSDDRKLQARQFFLDARRLWTRTTRVRKRVVELDTFRTIESSQRRTKLFWSRVKQLYNPLKEGKLPPAVVDLDGKIVTDLVGVLNTWKEYVHELGRERAHDPESDRISSDQYDDDFAEEVRKRLHRINSGPRGQPGNTPPELSRRITLEEVHSVVRDLKLGTSPGGDRVISELLIQGGVGLEMALTKLFNYLWEGTLWPEAWRRAHVFPLFKGGNDLDPKDYRTISMMSVTAKCFEMILNRRLELWSDRMGCISDLQGGFRKERSTTDQIWILKEIVRSRKEKNMPSYLTFVDVRKAYDTVWRNGLWKKLHDIGVRGKMLDMVQEMYRKVQRAVLVNGSKTEWVNVEAGVPQGAVLSPYMYSVYVDGLHQALRERGLGIVVHGRLVPLLLYADDIVLLAESPEQMEAMHRVLDEYARKWRFSVNNTKSNIVVVGSLAQQAKIRSRVWRLSGKALGVTNEYKYLGVEVGKFGRGEWTSALNRFISNAKERANLIVWVSGSKSGLRPASAVQLWMSMGRPLLEYACELWEGELSATVVNQLESVQTNFLRSITGASPSAPASALRRELGVQSLTTRRERLKIQYWLRMTNTESGRLLSHLYRQRASAVDRGEGKLSWCKGMKRLLEEWGLGQLWTRKQAGADNMDRDEIDHWKTAIEDASIKLDLGRCENQIKALPSLKLYSKLPVHPLNRTHPYLHDRYNITGTWVKLGLRLNTLPLMDRMASMLGWPAAGRRCPMCRSGETEDVPHFMLSCTAYQTERDELIRLIRVRVGEAASEDFQCGTQQTRAEMLLGTHSSFMSTDPQECAKARYVMDKVAKNYLRICWRARQQKMGRFRLQFRDGRSRLIFDEGWRSTVPEDESIAKAVTNMTRNARASIGVSDNLAGDGGWKEWVVRGTGMDWHGAKNRKKRKYFKVWRGRTLGVFYKWRDCWRSIRHTQNPSFKGYDTLQEAMNAS
jgi:hypothetical protein